MYSSRVSFPISLALHGAAVVVLSLLPAPAPGPGNHGERRIVFVPLSPPPAKAAPRPAARLEYAAPPRKRGIALPAVRFEQPALAAPEVKAAFMAPAASHAPLALEPPVLPPEPQGPRLEAPGFAVWVPEARAETPPAGRVSVGGFAAQRAAAAAEVAAKPLEVGSFRAAPVATQESSGPPPAARPGAFAGASSVVMNREPTPGSRYASTGGFQAAGFVAAALPSRRPATAAGFADAALVPAPAVSRRTVRREAERGVVIVEKPRPEYTEEARRLRIEGEVLLDVLFAAGGEVEVLRVRRGLGHGLDEKAVEAARRIRFRPAQAGGRAVDSQATVRVAFQLAF